MVGTCFGWKGNPPAISGKSRLVGYYDIYNVARYVLFCIDPIISRMLHAPCFLVNVIYLTNLAFVYDFHVG